MHFKVVLLFLLFTFSSADIPDYYTSINWDTNDYEVATLQAHSCGIYQVSNKTSFYCKSTEKFSVYNGTIIDSTNYNFSVDGHLYGFIIYDTSQLCNDCTIFEPILDLSYYYNFIICNNNTDQIYLSFNQNITDEYIILKQNENTLWIVGLIIIIVIACIILAIIILCYLTLLFFTGSRCLQSCFDECKHICNNMFGVCTCRNCRNITRV